MPDWALVVLGAAISIISTWIFAKHQVRQEARLRLWLEYMPPIEECVALQRGPPGFDFQAARTTFRELRSIAFLAGSSALSLVAKLEAAIGFAEMSEGKFRAPGESPELDQVSGQPKVSEEEVEDHRKELEAVVDAYCELKLHIARKLRGPIMKRRGSKELI